MLPNRQSKPGPVIDYLRELANHGDENIKDKARSAVHAVGAVLATPEGRILLELLEKSTLENYLPPSADERALSARNAQRFIVLDLRRIGAERETILDETSGVQRRDGNGRR